MVRVVEARAAVMAVEVRVGVRVVEARAAAARAAAARAAADWGLAVAEAMAMGVKAKVEVADLVAGEVCWAHQVGTVAVAMAVVLVAEAKVGAGLGTEGVEAMGMESWEAVVVAATDPAKPDSEGAGARVEEARVGAMAVAMGVLVEVTAAGVRAAAMEAVREAVARGVAKEAAARAVARVAVPGSAAGSVGVVMVVELEAAVVLGEVRAVAGTVGVPVEVTVAGVTAAAMAAEVSAVTVAERVVVGKVLAMAVVRREAAMDLETLEQEVAAERAQDLLPIFPDQTREAKALALPWRGRGHSTCCQQDAVRCSTNRRRTCRS